MHFKETVSKIVLPSEKGFNLKEKESIIFL